MVKHLRNDLEIESDALRALLIADGFKDDFQLTTIIRDEFLALQSEAMLQRVDELVSEGVQSFDAILQRVAPKTAAAGLRSDAYLLTAKSVVRVNAIRTLDRFMRPIPTSAPPLLKAQIHAMLAPIPVLSSSAAYSGYVDFVPSSNDAVVRQVPLIANYRGKLYPHMALATACAALDVKIETIRLEEDRIILPREGLADIEIPIRIERPEKFGPVGGFMDLPWFGDRGKEWWSIYDWKSFARPAQQESIRNVWRVQQFREAITTNESRARDAWLYVNIGILAGANKEQQLKAQWDDATSEARSQMLKAILSDEFLMPGVDELRKLGAEQLDERDQRLVASIDAMKNVLEQNDYFQERLLAIQNELRQKLEGKIVMVGWAAAGSYDYYPTCLHAQCPGVVIQGVAVNSILTQTFWQRSPPWLAPIITAMMGALVTLFVAFLPSYRALVATLVLALVYGLINGLLLFDFSNWIVPAAGAFVAASVVWGILTLYRYIFESAERSRITKRFSGYVDPAIVNFLVEDPDRVHFDGEVRDMTVVFTDLAGFTTISEKLQERTVPLLNLYMSRMMPIIRRHRGTWNKFLGDGIMFFYNAPVDNPNHARDSLLTVIEMQQEVEDFNKALLEQKLPKVAMRAGIVTGNMIAGDAGSIGENHEASDYTVLGDNVNLAARLESANKALGSRMLCVERTIELAGEGVLHRPIAKLQVVGKSQGVMTYEPLCLLKDATEQQSRLAAVTKEVVDAFMARDFENVIKIADRMQDEFGSSKFTALYLQQAREFLIEPPPADWDGTIVLESK